MQAKENKMKRILYDYKKKLFWIQQTGEIVSIPYVNNFVIRQLDSERKTAKLKDKLHKRNMQIKDLKTKAKDIVTYLQNETPLNGSYIMTLQRKFNINR